MVNRIYAKIQEAIEEDDDDSQNGELTNESWWEEIPTQQKERILAAYK